MQMLRQVSFLHVIFLILYLVFLSNNVLADVDLLLQQGRQLISERNIEEAHEKFQQAINEAPDNPDANFFYALTTIGTYLYSNDFNQLLDSLGVSIEGRDPFNWTASFTKDEDGNIILPSNAPNIYGIIDSLNQDLLPRIKEAILHLDKLGTDYSVILSPSETGAEIDLEVDYGDIALFTSCLYAVSSAIEILSSYNLPIDLEDIVNGELSDIQSIMAAYPSLLTLIENPYMPAAKSDLNDAINTYMEASQFIRSETDDQYDDLLTLQEDDLPDEEAFRNILSEIRNALSETTLITEDGIEQPFNLNLANFFDAPLDLSNYLPNFDRNQPIACSFPDSTFGGVLPDFTQDFLINGLGLLVSVTGNISSTVYTGSSNVIFVEAFDSPNFSGTPLAQTTTTSGIGTYSLDIKAGQTIYIRAFWDKDGDGKLSLGDYKGIYDPDGDGVPDGLEIVADNCLGPSDIDISIKTQVYGIQGHVTRNGHPLKRVTINIYGSKCWSDWLAWTFTDEDGFYLIELLPGQSVYVVAYDEQILWWNGQQGTPDCNEAIAALASAGDGVNADFDFAVIPRSGDTDHDWDVDGLDLVKMIKALGSTYEQPNYEPLCDMNSDDIIDANDVSEFAGNYGGPVWY